MLVIGSAYWRCRPITVLFRPALGGIERQFPVSYPMLDRGGRIIAGIGLAGVLF